MGIILVLLALAVVGTIVFRYTTDPHEVGMTMMVCAMVFLFLASFSLTGIRMDIRSKTLGFEQTRITIENARSNEGISEYEIAALQQKVVEYNAWLIVAQYWQRNLWVNWFIPASVQELEPLR